MQTKFNTRIYVLDIDTPITSSNAVIFDQSVSNTVLQFRLVKDNHYYTIPEDSKVIISIGDTVCDQADIKLIDRYKGLFYINLRKGLFTDGSNKSYEISIQIFALDTIYEPSYHEFINIKTTVFYSVGLDTLEQAINANNVNSTTTPIPTLPSPDFIESVANQNIPNAYIICESGTMEGEIPGGPDNSPQSPLLNTGISPVYFTTEN